MKTLKSYITIQKQAQGQLPEQQKASQIVEKSSE